MDSPNKLTPMQQLSAQRREEQHMLRMFLRDLATAQGRTESLVREAQANHSRMSDLVGKVNATLATYEAFNIDGERGEQLRNEVSRIRTSRKRIARIGRAPFKVRARRSRS